MNKRNIRDRILEVLTTSELLEMDPAVQDELAEALATAVTKLEMEEIFDADADYDESEGWPDDLDR